MGKWGRSGRWRPFLHTNHNGKVVLTNTSNDLEKGFLWNFYLSGNFTQIQYNTAIDFQKLSPEKHLRHYNFI